MGAQAGMGLRHEGIWAGGADKRAPRSRRGQARAQGLTVALKSVILSRQSSRYIWDGNYGC